MRLTEFFTVYCVIAAAPLGFGIGLYLILSALGFKFKPAWRRR